MTDLKYFVSSKGTEEEHAEVLEFNNQLYALHEMERELDHARHENQRPPRVRSGLFHSSIENKQYIPTLELRREIMEARKHLLKEQKRLEHLRG